MSEHYDFHYQPTGSGAISGQQVLQQTEDAINELGDYVNNNVGGAMDVAQQALETAQNAEQDAQTALDTANSFSSAIQSAQQDASTALSTAQTAQTTASNANNTAIQASQDANTAVTTANNASGQVSTLSGSVTALGQRVTTAEGNIGQNTSDITALTTRVGTAEGNITTLQNDVTIAQGNASSAMATAGTVKQQAYVFRYSSTALTPSSTNSNTLLDNTDNLKVGDKVIDSNGVLFSVTAIDTQNSTFTIGTALVDLAQDSDVVHKSGVETVAGFKQFANIRVTNSIKAIKLENTTTDLNNCYSDFAPYGENKGGNIQYYYCNTDAGTANISNLPEAKAFFLTSITTRLISNSLYVKQTLVNSTNKTYTRYCNNGTWGSWVNETDKYVTIDTAQAISGNKTFSSNVNVYNSDSATDTANIVLKNSKAERGSTTNTGEQTIFFLDKDNAQLGNIKCEVDASGISILTIQCTNSSNSNSGIRLKRTSTGTFLQPTFNNGCNLGTSGYRWYDVQTRAINGLEPSSLSLPSDNINDIIDISSYLSVLDGSNANTYIAPANGWISITMSNCSGIQAYITGLWGHQIVRPTVGGVRFFMPVLKNKTANILIFGGTIDNARFIPCQGNV